MRRYWIDQSSINGDFVELKGDIFHHICDVCRRNVSHKFEVLPGDGQAYLVELIEKNKKEARAKIIEKRQIPALKKPHIHLVISLPKYSTMDGVVEKSVEMGVHSVHPVVSEFSFVNDLKKISENKVKRWHKIIQGASQQSGRGELMALDEVRPLEQLLEAPTNRQGQNLGLFAYEGQASLDIKSFLRGSEVKSWDELWLFVGSEGGFSPNEVKRFQEVGMPSVTLGDQVLRVETACLALVSVLKYELGLLA